MLMEIDDYLITLKTFFIRQSIPQAYQTKPSSSSYSFNTPSFPLLGLAYHALPANLSYQAHHNAMKTHLLTNQNACKIL